MILCSCNPQLLNHNWAVELVQQHGGKLDNDGWTALILCFNKISEKVNINTTGFNLLWEMEKDINVNELK